VTKSPILFPEYGDGGDCLGCQRARKSFRLLVVSVVFLTFSFWFAENYLRYETTERLYLRALTLEPASARPFLRQAVKLDEAAPDVSTPKYLQALAEREEEPFIFETYEKAYRLDPNNSQLAIRYGCRLFTAGRYKEAREKFRDAARNDPDNALPLYLEASVIPWLEEENKDLRKALALIARANNSGKHIIMPRPSWASSLPQQGAWYARLRRQIINEVCFPLLYFTEFIAQEARSSIEARRLQYWDSWLEKIQGMGARLSMDALGNPATESSTPGAALQALNGIRIQITCVELRDAVHNADGTSLEDDLEKRMQSLISWRDTLEEFEKNWESSIAQEQRLFLVPLRLLGETLILLWGFYVIFALLAKLIKAPEYRWTVPHRRRGLDILVVAIFFLIGFLVFLDVMPFAFSYSQKNLLPIRAVWTLVASLIVLGGLLYPYHCLSKPKKAPSSDSGDSDYTLTLSARRKAFRSAYVVLVTRFYGIAVGLYIIHAYGFYYTV